VELELGAGVGARFMIMEMIIFVVRAKANFAREAASCLPWFVVIGSGAREHAR